jgi:Ca-activated chloride channel homolog
VGLLTFDNRGVAEKVSLGINRDQILSEVENMQAGGGTPLKSSIKYAYQSLTLKAQSQLGYGEYHLVVVTDGAASPGEDPSSVVNEILANSPVILHTIGFCIGEGHSLNVPGKTDYRAANNPEELRQGLAGVLAEANEYSMDKFEQTGIK